MLVQRKDQTRDGSRSRRLTASEDNVRGEEPEAGRLRKHDRSCREPERPAGESEAKVCSLQDAAAWTELLVRVWVGTAPTLTHLSNGASVLPFLLRQPYVRKFSSPSVFPRL